MSTDDDILLQLTWNEVKDRHPLDKWPRDLNEVLADPVRRKLLRIIRSTIERNKIQKKSSMKSDQAQQSTIGYLSKPHIVDMKQISGGI